MIVYTRFGLDRPLCGKATASRPGRPGHCRIVIHPGYLKLLIDAGLSTYARITGPESGRTIARSGSSRTARVETDEGAFFVKTYRYDTWKKRFRGALRNTLLRPSRAGAEWASLGLQRRLGIEAVEPVAFGEHRQRGFVVSCFLVTREEVGWTPLDRELAGQLLQSPGDRRALVADLAAYTRGMHGRGYRDGNYRFRNLLVRREGSGFSFRNLDSPRGRRSRSRRAAERDLGTLEADARPLFTRSERLRFYRAYRGLGGAPMDREAIRRILEHARHRAGSHAPTVPF